MANNLTTQHATLATIPDATVIETLDQGGGVQRQVVSVGNTPAVTVASLPLPSGAATSALQTTINTTLGTPMQATGGTVGLVAGTAVIGHVIVDTAPTTAVTIATAPVLVAGSAIIGKVGIDQTTPGTTNLVATTPHNALHAAGTNGFIVTPFTVISSSEFSALTNGSGVVSANSGSSGKFTQSNFGNAQFGFFYLTVVTAGWTPTAGGCISGWYELYTDGATTLETLRATPSSTVAAFPRPPDFSIPLPAAAMSAGDVYFSQRVALPYAGCKVYVQNNTGATTGTGNHTITCCPIGDQG